MIVARFILFFLVFFLFPLPGSAAELNKADRTHAQNAFLFVDRGGWNDALLHARKASNPLLLTTVQWLYCKEKDSGASFEQIAEFIRRHPGWPNEDTLIQRAEEALVTYPPSPEISLQWFKKHPPVTGRGKIFHAQMMGSSATAEEVTRLVREAWVNGDFELTQEIQILSLYGPQLRQQDHIDRTARLLWEGKTAPAGRMSGMLPADYRALFDARSALTREDKQANTLVSRVPKALSNDPGLLYDRMMWRERRGMDSGVEEILRTAPANVPYPTKWWDIRVRHIRQAIEEDRRADAGALLSNHGQHIGAPYAEALWLNGWYNLEFKNNPREAYTQFYALFNFANFPVSKARGAYWAGRAAMANGNKDTAKGWFEQASAYPTTFYGQLASSELRPGAPLNIPAPHTPTAAEHTAFKKRELVRAALLLSEANQNKLAERFIFHLLDQSQTASDYVLAARVGMETSNPQLSVRSAKRALQKGYTMAENGYPMRELPPMSLEPNLAFSIIRQESEFDRTARSPAGAMGLMQLMPATAKEVSRKLKLGFAPGRLYEPDYNMQLGSAYLARLINSYDGSYIQAIAAYNAGPGNVRKWRNEFGVPGKTPDQAIRWIEMIPFDETRNYVQRVLENLQVYRHLSADKQTPGLRIKDDLVR